MSNFPPGFGAMDLSSAMGRNLTFEEGKLVLLKAIELGCTFLETAISWVTVRKSLIKTIKPLRQS